MAGDGCRMCPIGACAASESSSLSKKADWMPYMDLLSKLPFPYLQFLLKHYNLICPVFLTKSNL